eukprot:1823633-Pyramimonas_sp.AAC.1
MPTTNPFGANGSLSLCSLRGLRRAAKLVCAIGGDWDAPPDLLGQLEWASRLGGRTIAPGAPACAAGQQDL